MVLPNKQPVINYHLKQQPLSFPTSVSFGDYRYCDPAHSEGVKLGAGDVGTGKPGVVASPNQVQSSEEVEGLESDIPVLLIFE